MKEPIKNHGRSVKTRLLNLMKSSGYKYMYLLTRYFNERLLYRVSVSSYRDNFMLKGGTLLYALNGLQTRPTIDIDFLAHRISRDRVRLEKVFREILSIECEEDGVSFDVDRLRSEPITIEKQYPGTRFFVNALMDTIVFPMSMDVGFGDVVTPSPVSVDFPLLLPDVPSINIQAYSLETVVAEKFHAMLVRDVSNSRMKDFFDCYQILTSKGIDNEMLYEAIRATFDNRELVYNANLQLFGEGFCADEVRLKRWEVFLKKIQWKNALLFADVMAEITGRLKCFYDRYWDEKSK